MADTKKRYRGMGKVVFLARLDGIAQMAAQGYPLRAIYDRYAAELGIGYRQFLRYVRRWLKPGPPA